jgi:synaptojanin
VQVATIRIGETVDRIHSVEFYSLNRSRWDGFGPNYYSQIPGDYDYDAERVVAEGGEIEHPCAELKKLLSGGSFFFSTDCDLTNRLQNRYTHLELVLKCRSFNAPFDLAAADEQFLWNSYMLAPMIPFRDHLNTKDRTMLDSSRLLTPVIRGYASTVRCTIGLMPGMLTLISRVSCRRAGTRFNARGIDDEGNVANFVETETVIATDEWVFSYTQIRGSVPLFWEQNGLQLPGTSKITITRSPEASQPAFNLHFSTLEQKYGAVHVVNLLSQGAKQGESNLGKAYASHLDGLPLEDRRQTYLTNFDFHAITGGDFRLANGIRPLLSASEEEFVYYLEDSITKSVVLEQSGVFRTNCLDCLDRTNVIQGIISQIAIDCFLGHRDQVVGEQFWVVHGGLWADTGDALSKTYAGTGALKSSFTRTGIRVPKDR